MRMQTLAIEPSTDLDDFIFDEMEYKISER